LPDTRRYYFSIFVTAFEWVAEPTPNSVLCFFYHLEITSLGYCIRINYCSLIILYLYLILFIVCVQFVQSSYLILSSTGFFFAKLFGGAVCHNAVRSCTPAVHCTLCCFFEKGLEIKLRVWPHCLLLIPGNISYPHILWTKVLSEITVFDAGMTHERPCTLSP
jgi:hypothetical protein